MLKKSVKGLAIALLALLITLPQTGVASMMFINAAIYQSVTPSTFFVVSGNYAGTGSSQSITVGCQPVMAMIKANGTNTEDDAYIFNDASMTAKMSPTTAQASYGFSVGATAFGVPGAGTDQYLNASGSTYYYVVICGDSTEVKTGSYTGNATDNRSITGIGFQPDIVFVKRANTVVDVIWKATGMGTNQAFQLGAATTFLANTVQDLESDGFQVGTSGTVNGSGATYYYTAIKIPTGAGNCGMYTGNSTDDTDISITSAIQPEWVYVKGNTTVNPNMRGTGNTGDDTSRLINSTANSSNRIQALNSDGFQVGTNGEVNTTATDYYYCALKDE